MPLSRSVLSPGQRAVFNYLFGRPDETLQSFVEKYAGNNTASAPWLLLNNHQAKLLGQPKNSWESIARVFARSEISVLQKGTYGHPDQKINAQLDEGVAKVMQQLSKADNTKEFWTFIENYYVQVIAIGYDSRKVKQAFCYQAKSAALYGMGVEAVQIYQGRTATQHLEHFIARYKQKPGCDLFPNVEGIGQELRELRAELQAFDRDLKNYKLTLIPRSLVEQFRDSFKYVLGVTVVFYLSGLIDFKTAAAIVTLYAAGLYYIDHINSENNKKVKYLKQQLQKYTLLLTESVELHPVIYVQHDGSEIETHARVYDSEELTKKEKTPSAEPQAAATDTVAAANVDDTAAAPKLLKRKHLPTSAPAASAGKVPSSQPVRIKFANGMVYDSADDKCPVKLIDATKKLYGFLDEKEVSKYADAKEMDTFHTALATEKLLPANSKGKSGIKSIAHNQNIFFHCPQHNMPVRATEKLKINTGARVFGHRTPAADNSGANLTEFIYYAAPKQAHRL